MSENDPTSSPPVQVDYLSPQTQREARRKRWPQLLASGTLAGLIVAVLVIIVAPLFDRSERGPSTVPCLANLRTIGISLSMYAQRNGGAYPPRLAEVMTICPPGTPPSMLVCPSSSAETAAATGATPQQTVANVLAGNHASYVYLGAGKSGTSLPPGAVLVYEPVGNHARMYRGTGAANVLFADGHAATFSAATVTQMIKELNAGQNPPPVLKGR